MLKSNHKETHDKVMKFKTNAKCEDCMASIIKAVRTKFPNAELKFEEENTDKVLHVHGLPEDSVHASQVESAIKESGFDGAWISQADTDY